jgi:uncharacterized membrane protein (DUF4010 family)
VETNDAIGIAIAALGGAAVGLEREWSGHASGPHARFAGIRTFTLLGLNAGIAGVLYGQGHHVLALLLAGACAALIIAAYVAASRVDVDGTTEMAALVVLTAGVLAGMHSITLASALIAVTTLLLLEKSRLQKAITHIDDVSLRAGIRFAVMAVVILPLLPSGPYGPLGGIRPRQLWALVLFFSGLSFAGYISRRFAGSQRGYPIAGMIGGIISSTSVTLSFARLSRSEPDRAASLAIGAIGASAVMCIRVLVSTSVLNPPAGLALLPYLIVPFLTAALITAIGLRKFREPATAETLPSNPLQFLTALQMAVLFQCVLFAVRWAQMTWGNAGVIASASVLGLTDLDALVISMAKDAASHLSSANIAQAIAVGVLSNTMLKMLVGAVVGIQPFRRIVVAGLLAMGVACAGALFWLR